MKFIDVFSSYVGGVFVGTEVEQAIKEFVRHVPAGVLQMEFDTSRSNKQGVKDGNKVYKLGLDLANATVFIEYFESFDQAQPTMAISVNKATSQVTINGWQANERLFIRYAVVDGKIRKSVQVS